MSERHLDADCGIRGAPSEADTSDAELLERFVTSRDEAAFAALMTRHGPMVFGICRRLLHHAQDAEDAFQATFLILVRKASRIGNRELLGNWLYGVALRVAARARDMVAKRRTREAMDMEQIAQTMREPAETTDVASALTEEVQLLPAKYRGPIVLCYFQGRSNEEAAGEMRCPVGTIKTRLSRARDMLRKRLIRRGLVLSTAAFSAAFSVEALAAPLPPALFDSALKAALDFAAGDAAALGLVSAQAAALTKGVLKTMLLTKLKTVVAMLFVVAIVGFGAGLLLYATAEGKKGQKDLEAIQGTWYVKAWEENGVLQPKERFEATKMRYVFKGDKLSIVQTTPDGRDDGGTRWMTITLDEKTSPKRLDASRDGKTLQGIYAFEKGQLKICIDLDGKSRPKEFKTSADGQHDRRFYILEKKDAPAK